MRRDDPVGMMLLHALAGMLEGEVGTGVGFAIFIDWRDGGLPSYASNVAPRRVVVDALVDWLSRFDAALAVGAGDVVDLNDKLQGKVARIAREFEEEDCGVVLFVFGGERVHWASTMPRGRELVRAWIEREGQRS